MKNYVSVFLILCLFACNKNVDPKTASAENISIDSMNQIIARKNDSIETINNKNRFADLTGSHKLIHNNIKKTGEIMFEKIGRDEYKVLGKIEGGSNTLKISGKMKQVSADYMNLEGEITQNITQDGKEFKRENKNTFKKQAKFWRLQNKVNGAGFVDYIDIY